MEVKSSQSKNKKFSRDKLSFFIEAVARFCDRCGTPYTPHDLQIIQESQSSSIIHFSCVNCKTQHMATFVRPIGVSSRMPINTDLNVDEMTHFSGVDKVVTDDVLDIYTLLSKKGSLKL